MLPIILATIFFACKKDNTGGQLIKLLDTVPARQYYYDDIFKNISPEIYGTWKVIGTSGGFAGNGYPPDFDYLLVKPNAVFGIVRNNSLLTTGKLEIVERPPYDLLVHFVSDTPPNEVNVEIISDYEKFLVFQSDTLSLYSTCCDRFDTHLKKVD